MKVLHFVGFSPDMGGPYTSVYNLTRALADKGCKPGICSIVPPGHSEHDIGDPGYLKDLINLKTDNLVSRIWTSYTPELENLRSLIKEYDIVHVNGVFDYFAYFVFRKMNIPYVVSPHGTLQKELLAGKGGFKKKLYLSVIGNRILAVANGIHALTDSEKISLNYTGISNKNTEVIPNGINREDFNDLPPGGLLFENYPELKGKDIVLFLGRINWKKGLDDLIPAFREVVNNISNSHLVIVGPDREGYMAEVNKWIGSFGLEEFVTYTGPAYGKDKLMFLQDADLFVLPSYSEGFPMAVIEAMYMGLPVIITKNSGIPDIVGNNNAGVVVNKDRKEIASSIIKILNDRITGSEMGRKGKELVDKHFTWDRIAERMVRFYEKALRI